MYLALPSPVTYNTWKLFEVAREWVDLATERLGAYRQDEADEVTTRALLNRRLAGVTSENKGCNDGVQRPGRQPQWVVVVRSCPKRVNICERTGNRR